MPEPTREPLFCTECGATVDPEWFKNSGGLCGGCLAGHGFTARIASQLDRRSAERASEPLFCTCCGCRFVIANSTIFRRCPRCGSIVVVEVP